MKLYVADQAPHFAAHLHRLQSGAVMPYTGHQLREARSAIELGTSISLQQLSLSALYSYNVFPPHIMTAYCQWLAEGRDMQVGDTIVQQIFLPPFHSFSCKLICGVRISGIISEPLRRGFSYETLTGHVERGISTFTVQQQEQGLEFVIHTLSAPAGLLPRLAAPFFAIPFQAYCTRQALVHTADAILSTRFEGDR